jgi:hypothetical protein
MNARAAAFLAWFFALARIAGGALLLWALDAPSWAIAGWLLANVRVRFRLPSDGSKAR